MRPEQHDDQLEPCDGIPIRALRLRELVVLILVGVQTSMTIAELVDAVHARGFRIGGRPGKTVSDQLRYELERGRASKVSRGVYMAGQVTRQSKSRMRRRIRALVAAHAATHDNGVCPHVTL